MTAEDDLFDPAAFDALVESMRRVHAESATSDVDPRSILIDWTEFWDHDREEVEWLAEPIIPAKRSVAMFAPGGTGKSLLALWIGASLATGGRLFGRAVEPIDVLYLDYEMTEDDLAERLESMGIGPETDLTRLHYALLPSLPGLDEPEGGKAVTELARLVDAQLVVVDTFGRAVHGDENEADTVRAWYRWTGLHLKAEGRAFIRVDHAGKDLDKGQRGTSAKNDDVDIVWRLSRQEGETFRLTARKRRMSWVPEKVDIELTDEPVLAYSLTEAETYPPRTKEVAERLEALGVSPTASIRDATSALRERGEGARRQIIVAAQRWRRESLPAFRNPVDNPGNRPGNHLSVVPPGTAAGTTTGQTSNPLVDGLGTTTGTGGNHPPRTSGNHGAPLKGAPVPSADDDDYRKEPIF